MVNEATKRAPSLSRSTPPDVAGRNGGSEAQPGSVFAGVGGEGSEGPVRGGLRRSLSQTAMGLPNLVHPGVDARDLLDVTGALGVGEAEDLRSRPVEVVGDVRDLLVETVGPVRHDSPRRLPARSTSKDVSQFGQVTSARVWPSALIRR